MSKCDCRACADPEAAFGKLPRDKMTDHKFTKSPFDDHVTTVIKWWRNGEKRKVARDIVSRTSFYEIVALGQTIAGVFGSAAGVELTNLVGDAEDRLYRLGGAKHFKDRKKFWAGLTALNKRR